jgi:hypothetical protein
MSAFMMSPESIAKITAYVHREIASSVCEFDWIKTIREACRKYDAKNSKVVNIGTITAETLFRVLEFMNAESLSQRYDDNIKDNVSAQIPAFPFWGNLNKVEIFKLIQCYTYQCAEGNVPESPLYKAMETLENEVCYDIVKAMPEYDTAAWG